MIIFQRKILCHSRDSNHRSPVFRTGALTTQATVTSLRTRKQISLSFQVSIQDSRECNMLLFFLRATHKWVFQFGFTYNYLLTSRLVLYLTLIIIDNKGAEYHPTIDCLKHLAPLSQFGHLKRVTLQASCKPDGHVSGLLHMLGTMSLSISNTMNLSL